MTIKPQDIPLAEHSVATASPSNAELPPAYTPPQSQVASSSAPVRSPTVPPEYIKPTNFLYITRTNSSIKDSYVIDPNLRIPEAILPPLEEGEMRKNVKLGSTHNAIYADLWIVGSEAPTSSSNTSSLVKRTTIEVTSKNGYCSVKLHNSSPYPFHLECKSHTGSIKILLPQNFQGPLTALSDYGSVTFSKAVSRQLIVFSEVNNKRFCFVGDYEQSGWGENPDAWVGDEVHVESSYGSVKVSFVDEEPDVDSRGWLSRWFDWMTHDASVPIAGSGETVAAGKD
ncbi:hypothetical protein JAAARDRAFT_56692 [Jaapia argillacea MUCL 33604]|uniref:DUF7330 domain-containing protein n=1 Tax=Jaapia argillacea MUCL 33604 TaxID=933084 RepID=A0A067QAW0_9AGAM|nr:hypothetical protein JAAARDRAFT_56692 [Jaapia argillacea MUCL 33604]